MLKRQAAKARRYKRLREELRRWEKVLFARRYRVLAADIESARARLSERREAEAAAAARLSAAEDTLARTRLELAQAESAAGAARESAHARELDIDRQQNQISLNAQQLESLGARSGEIGEELAAIEARREPAHEALVERREAASRAAGERDQASGILAAENAAYDTAYLGLQSLEADVDLKRQEVYLALTAISSLQHAIDNAAAARERVEEELARLEAERSDVDVEDARLQADLEAGRQQLATAQVRLERVRAEGEARQVQLSDARDQHEQHRLDTRAGEQDLASVEARLTSLEELEAARAQYGDAARFLLADRTAGIRQFGSVADCLEVDRGYERAVESYLGDLLQHVLVPDHDEAARGLALVREHNAGRCGFLVAGGEVPSGTAVPAPPADGLVPMASVVRITGDHAGLIRHAIGHAWIASSFAGAAAASQCDRSAGRHPRRRRAARRAPRLRRRARGIARHPVHQARDQGAARPRRRDPADLARLAERTEEAASAIDRLTQEIARLVAEAHAQEKAIVGFEALVANALENRDRLDAEGGGPRRPSAPAPEEERRVLEDREREARESVARQEDVRLAADERLAIAQRQFQDAREAAEVISRRVADARAAHAALVERATALLTEVARQEDVIEELESRSAARQEEARQNQERQAALRQAIEDGKQRLDLDLQDLDRLRGQVREADERLSALRLEADAEDVGDPGRPGRRSTPCAPTSASSTSSRVTAESDLAHLASTCVEAVQATLDQVLAEVEEAEREGPGRRRA